MKNRFHLVSNNAGWFKKPTIELSTIALHYGQYNCYESCLFSANDSEVLARYDTMSEAVQGHQKLCKKYGLKNDVIDC